MFVALGPLRRSKAQRLLLLSESRLLARRLTKAAGDRVETARPTDMEGDTGRELTCERQGADSTATAAIQQIAKMSFVVVRMRNSSLERVGKLRTLKKFRQLGDIRRDPPCLIHRGSRKALIEAHSHDQRARPR
jgi:hypothetical protein